MIRHADIPLSDETGPVIVTGVAGFVGSHVAQALVRRGREVVGIDNFDPCYDPALKRSNVQELAGAARAFRLVEADIRDAAAMCALFERTRPAAVMHLAARAGVRASLAEPGLYSQVNVEGTVNLLEAARRTTMPRFVLASSSSVYGNRSDVPFSEEDDASAPISPYAATKRACELMVHTYTRVYGLPAVSLRFFTVFGPRQRPDLAIARFMRIIAAGEPVPMFGDGTSSRDYTYIDDIVAGALAALDRARDCPGRTWNLGGEHPVALSGMIDAVAEVVGRPARVQRLPEQRGDVAHTFADLTRSRAELGFEPRTEFHEGLRLQWDWLRDRLAVPC